MPSQDQKQVNIIILLVMLGFVFYLVFKYLLTIFTSSDTAVANSVSAFAGAFFAFVFIGIGNFLSKVHHRKVTHYNSVVKLGIQLNEMGGIINDNMYSVDNIRAITSRGDVCWNLLRRVPRNKAHLLKLHNIGLINKVSALFYDIRRLNDDAEMINDGFRELRQALIQNNISRERYWENTGGLAPGLTVYKKFMEAEQGKIIRLLAEIRILEKKDKPLVSTFISFIITSFLSTVSEEDVEGEITKLRIELKESAEVGRREKEDVLAAAAAQE